MTSQEMAELKKEFRTAIGGSVVKRVYTESDVTDLKKDDIGLPGEYPFTRNIMPSGYRTRLWTMRQYAGFGTGEETNARYKYLYRPGSVSPSTCLLRWATTPTIPSAPARWAGAGSP